MSPDERVNVSFAAATEVVKQLLVLATASIGGTIALFGDRKSAGINFGPSATMVYIALWLLAFSVVFGLFALGMLAGQLGSNRIEQPSTYATGVRVMSGGQMVLYGLGILALIVAAKH